MTEQTKCFVTGTAGFIGSHLVDRLLARGATVVGFLMFYAPNDRHEDTARSLKGLRRVDLALVPQGSKIMFVHDSLTQPFRPFLRRPLICS